VRPTALLDTLISRKIQVPANVSSLTRVKVVRRRVGFIPRSTTGGDPGEVQVQAKDTVATAVNPDWPFYMASLNWGVGFPSSLSHQVLFTW